MSDLSISDRSDIGPAVAQWPDIDIPVSIMERDESLAGWPFDRKHFLKMERIIHGPHDDAERILGRPIYQETRRHDMREMMSIANRRSEK